MRQYERGGITVDQCGECRGIFLDRGELDRLVDVENAGAGPAAPAAPQAQAPAQHYGPPEYYAPKEYGKPPKKRSSFLSELFE